MRKRIIISTLLISLAFTLCSCSSSQELDNLKKENEELKTKVSTLQTQLDAKQKETTVEAGDVTVVLTNKSSIEGEYGVLYATCVFGITNNTNKNIKGIEGTAIFKDMFGKTIKNLNCDFTGQIIKTKETVSVDDLSVECNPFIDDDKKLYSTAYGDLKFEYQVKSIVFEDGTTKTGNT